ncbi:MAG: LacI family DNA-binding transcriptional regulator [Faecalicatena sp.]|uniref:LacI family DNA-binding transcriptional regulator n=1 Tax=Faecalicatena sp. TaxID=2005360 RepID=UPI002587F5F3|nr:LacI family DNA-binding transcriptional regulator [Faecalicatena sp.]MCI6464669.1 LacI family DNA-binding transcriptional regulator [Faecalicatena sp.]MDY5618247.1 LacI family DNA-binding transcriptional regulator [Lachnospiraceae bacterium]
MANIKDVAERAGVSVTTVSRVLNNKGYISQDTYDSVYRAIEQLDYVPNQIARNLFKQKSYYISLIVPDSSNPFWAEITKYIELKLYKYNYKLFLCNTNDTEDKEREYIKMMRQNMVDGIILGTHMLNQEEYQNLELPIVSLDLHIADQIPTIYSNHQKGGMLAAEELVRSQCQCVLNITAVLGEKSPSIERHRIVSRVLKEHGIRCIEHIWDANVKLEDYYLEVERLFDLYPEIDAVFSEDFIVMNAIKCANERGKKIPQEFKAVGYDGTIMAKISYPSMTYVAQPIKKLADNLVEVLLKKIKGVEITGDIILEDIKLVRGNTTPKQDEVIESND